ncbi:MAG TPA: hypothetical protein VN371_01960 [Chlorobaculum sp.]|nr:hypothetical protein [Chlorobaculum sp.]
MQHIPHKIDVSLDAFTAYIEVSGDTGTVRIPFASKLSIDMLNSCKWRTGSSHTGNRSVLQEATRNNLVEGIGQKVSDTKKTYQKSWADEGQNSWPTGNLLFDNEIYDYGSNTASVMSKHKNIVWHPKPIASIISRDQRKTAFLSEGQTLRRDPVICCSLIS